jgi:very-short-patch-repair endonuclease
VSRALRKAGWRVLRAWEHELANQARIVSRIQRALDCLREGGG